jgi:hypothetical protein
MPGTVACRDVPNTAQNRRPRIPSSAWTTAARRDAFATFTEVDAAPIVRGCRPSRIGCAGPISGGFHGSWQLARKACANHPVGPSRMKIGRCRRVFVRYPAKPG